MSRSILLTVAAQDSSTMENIANALHAVISPVTETSATEKLPGVKEGVQELCCR
jgi:hypothetical protein